MDCFSKSFCYGLVLSVLIIGSVQADNDKEQQRYKMRQKVVETNLYVFKTMFDLYKKDNAVYPTNEQGFKALVENPLSGPKAVTWKGPYMKDMPLDVWSHPYQYQLKSNGTIEISSLGRDGKPGGTGMDKDIKLSDFE